MFRKLVSNLPFSPALVGQLSFYAQRLRREETTRRLGLLFVILAVFVQAFAVFSPPEQVIARVSEEGRTIPPIQAITQAKAAHNLTRERALATNNTIRPGDRIEYTLTTSNTGTETVTTTLEENLADVLEYGRLVENGGGTLHSETNILRWDGISLAPGQSDTRRLVVQVHDTIPATPRAANNPNSYDCIMTNTYGNRIELPIECPVAKNIENTVTALPSIGPAENMLFAVIVLVLTTYFYIRNRQLRKEVQLLRKEFGGGTL